MRPRLTIPLTREDKAACARWSRRVLGIWVLIVIATLSLPIFRGEQANVSRERTRDQAAVRSEFPSGSVHHVTGDPAVQRW
jgi:hypothetical protein